MIKIDLLKNHPHSIPTLSNIWYEVLGRIWLPDIAIDAIAKNLEQHLNQDNLPITFVASDKNKAIGMCSLRNNDGIRPDLTPWLGSLVVDSKYQKQGIGKMLLDATILKAKELGFKKLYLFAFDPTIPEYYGRLGWKKIDMDEFKGYPVTVMETKL